MNMDDWQPEEAAGCMLIAFCVLLVVVVAIVAYVVWSVLL